MTRIRQSGGFVAAVAASAMLLLSVATTTTTVRADVLEHVPSDAIVLIKVNNLKGTSDKVAKLANDLGFAAMAPQMADPLGFVQQQTKMLNGVNTAGEAAFVFLSPEQFGGNPEQAMYLLIPVSDYQAFIGNWGEAQVEGAVAQVTIEGAPQPYFVTQRGDYAAFGPNRELVTRDVAEAITLPDATARQLQEKDAIVVANFKQLGPMLLPKVQQGREEMLREMEEDLASDPQAAKFAPVIKSLANQTMNVVEGYLRDSQAAAFGIGLTDEGITTTIISDFAADSYAGQAVAKLQSEGADAKLAGLPDGKYLFFGGGTSDPEVSVKLLDDFAGPIVQELVALGPEYKAAENYYQALRDYVQANESSSFGLRAPSGQLGQDSLIQGISVLRGDAEKMQDAYQRMMTAQQELMLAFGLPPEQFQMSFTEDAKNVAGVSFDALKSDMQVDPNDPSAQQAQQFINMLYGPEGAVVYLGVVEGKLLSGVGVSDEVLAQAVESAKTGDAPLSNLAGVQAVSQKLPQQNLAVFYVAVDQIVTTAMEYAQQFNVGMPIQLPPDLPPVGASIATEGPALRVDIYVPTQLVQSLVAAGMQAAMQMQGGGGGGEGL